MLFTAALLVMRDFYFFARTLQWKYVRFDWYEKLREWCHFQLLRKA